MQDNTTAHTANDSIADTESIFKDRIISHDLWPPWSPDLNSCKFYLWGKLKSKVYKNIPYTLEELKNNIQQETENISPEEFCCVSSNLF